MLSHTRPLLNLHAPKLAAAATTTNTTNTTHFSSLRLLPRCYSLSTTQLRMSSTTTTTTTTTSFIEHVLLFNVKDTATDSQVSAMINGLNALQSLDMVQYITAGPIHCNRSSFKFTHLLHSRYNSKEDLAAYAVHPDHADLAKSSILPICDDIMAMDWVVPIDLPGSDPKPGSAMRVQFLKLKEGLGEREKGEVLDVIAALKSKANGIEEFTFGENFSPARAKGFSIASIGFFKGLEVLEDMEKNEEDAMEKDKVSDYIDSLVIVDYVIPSGES